MPEAEFRQLWDATPAGRPTKARDFPGAQVLMSIMTGATKYTDIAVPALVIFALPHVPDKWMDKTTAAARFKRIDALTEKQAQAWQRIPTARVIRLRGAHYIFLSNAPEVLRETRLFLAGLK